MLGHAIPVHHTFSQTKRLRIFARLEYNQFCVKQKYYVLMKAIVTFS